MKAAPGSALSVNDIVGRDAFVARLWEILEHSSVRMEAERRIGKTSILYKMQEEAPFGWEAVFLDLEEVHSATEFAEKVGRSVQQRLTGWKKQGRRLSHLIQELGGTTVGPIQLPGKDKHPRDLWKRLLIDAIEDLIEQQQAAGKRVVFFFDELPWMITAIAAREGAQTAMEVLDVLRGFRQSPSTAAGFRMVLCGSIGLHHVLEELKRQGYRNRPVNDMVLEEVPPLDLTIAADLAGRLLAAEKIVTEPGVPRLIAEQTGGFAFYIHWIVFELRKAGSDATRENIERIVKTLLTTSHDPCDFGHFKRRIEDYYPREEDVVLALLDHAAASPSPIPSSELINIAKTAGANDDKRIRELLRLLSVDHYLERDTEGHYSFRHVMLRRWWLFEQGLEVQKPAEE